MPNYGYVRATFLMTWISCFEYEEYFAVLSFHKIVIYSINIHVNCYNQQHNNDISAQNMPS